MDGRRQRNAVTAAEQVIAALAAGDAVRALADARKAAELDQIGIFATLPEAVAAASADLDAGRAISAEAWDQIGAALPAGPLQAAVDAHRT